MSTDNRIRYRLRIQKTDDRRTHLAELVFPGLDDDKAALLMNDVLTVVAKHNDCDPRDCNSNLYKEQWINGI